MKVLCSKIPQAVHNQDIPWPNKNMFIILLLRDILVNNLHNNYLIHN
jgi:hypothetical protein